jgi:hypothetical protein
MGRVRIEGNRVVNDSTMIDRYGDPAIVPFSIPKDDFEELIGRPIPNGVETLEFVATPRGCQLHFGGPEVDRNLIRSHVTMIKNERERYGTDIIAERYVLGLTSGNPRAENSYYDVYESIGIANEVETAEGLERGTSKLVRGETNLSKEIVHALGGQTPLAWNTQREMDNMAEWAGAMGQTGMPVIIHVDSGLPAQANLSTVGQGLTGFKMHSDLGNVDRFIEFARNAPDTDIVWAHAGLGFTVEMPPNYTDTLQRVLDAAPNVKIDISWDAIHRYIAEDPDAWARFIVRNEDRIIFGSDTIATSQNPAPNSRMNVAEGLRRTGLVEAMDRIDPDGSAVEKLFSGNYQATITPGVDRVNEFRTHPENVAWLERRGYESGEPPPYIWARDDDGNYLPNLIRNPAPPPEQ